LRDHEYKYKAISIEICSYDTGIAFKSRILKIREALSVKRTGTLASDISNGVVPNRH